MHTGSGSHQREPRDSLDQPWESACNRNKSRALRLTPSPSLAIRLPQSFPGHTFPAGHCPSTMATFSDGLSHPESLDFSFHSSSSDDMRQHLQNLLDGKEKQLQQAAALGERLLAQRVELEERVRIIQEVDADKTDEVTADMRERYRELADTVRAWDFGNVQLTTAFTPSVRILISFHSVLLLVLIAFFGSFS